MKKLALVLLLLNLIFSPVLNVFAVGNSDKKALSASMAIGTPVFLTGIATPIAIVSGASVTLVAGGVALAVLSGYGMGYLWDYIKNYFSSPVSKVIDIVENDWNIESEEVRQEYENNKSDKHCSGYSLNDIMTKGNHFIDTNSNNCKNVDALWIKDDADGSKYCYISWIIKEIGGVMKKVLCHIKYQGLPKNNNRLIPR